MPGLPLAPGPWLVAFVDHVATEYPISVFDAHFRPPEPPAEAATRRSALARDCPAFIQAVANLPEDAKGWWYTEESLKKELVVRHGPGSSVDAIFDHHPELLGSLFKPEGYVQRNEQNMTLRNCSDTRYLWVPKTDGREYVQLSVQAAGGHQRPLTYMGGNVDMPLLPRGVMANFARAYEAPNLALQQLGAASSSSPSIFVSSRKRGDAGDIKPPASTWQHAGPGLFSAFDPSTSVLRTVLFSSGDNGSFSAVAEVNRHASSVTFPVADADKATDLLAALSSFPRCVGYSSDGLRSSNDASLASYSAGFVQLSASSKVAAGRATHDAVPLPWGVLGVLYGADPVESGVGGEASGSAGLSGGALGGAAFGGASGSAGLSGGALGGAAFGGASGSAGLSGAALGGAAQGDGTRAWGSGATAEVPAFFLLPCDQKPFEPATVSNGTFFSAKCEVLVMPDGAEAMFAVGTTPGTYATGKWAVGSTCKKCSAGRESFVKRAQRASKRGPELAAHPNATAAAFANEPWHADERQGHQSKRLASLQGMVRNRTEALVRSEGLLVLSTAENTRLLGLMKDAAKVASTANPSLTWIEDNFATGTVRTAKCNYSPPPLRLFLTRC